MIWASIRKYGYVAKPIGSDKKRQSRNLGEAVGALVTDLRKKKGWSQNEMAERLGFNVSTVTILETATKSPTLRTLQVVARGFGLEVSTLIRAAERRIKR
jgi:transcriptional regulator with XRE-family HTH domain